MNEVLEKILSELQGMNSRIGNLETEMQGMNSRIGNLETEMQGMNSRIGNLEEGQEEIKLELKNINRKLDTVYEQTADLTEFKTEVTENLTKLCNDLNAIEVITSKNWNDIAKLKAVK